MGRQCDSSAGGAEKGARENWNIYIHTPIYSIVEDIYHSVCISIRFFPRGAYSACLKGDRAL